MPMATQQQTYTIYNPMQERTEALRSALKVLDAWGALDLQVLLRLQRVLLDPHDYGWGQLRDGPATVLLHGRVVQELPRPSDAIDMANNAIQWLNRNLCSDSPSLSPIHLAGEVVFRLAQAHPFWDGNGRVSRAVGTWVLLRYGYELVSDLRLYCRQRTVEYYKALAARQCCGAKHSDSCLWHTFFANMVGYCFRPPRRNVATVLSGPAGVLSNLPDGVTYA